MCDRFISFFGNIHENRINRVIINFGLLDGYRVHDKLDQNEQLCEYWINTKFVLKTGRIENGGRITFYFAAGVFIATQYALDIASEFFDINDISINNKKTVVISINQGIKVASLSISEQPILIAKKDETHYYLGIFLFTKGLSKPSVVKAHSDVRFFVNIVLRKTIMNKQFSYLVSAVLQAIISYWTQFSFVSSNMCHKWDVMIKKNLRLKACLLHNFLNVALHYLFLYDLKSFEQVQSKGKMAFLIPFSNASGILGQLFNHRFLDLQVLGWAFLDPLQFSVKLHISSVNNFLAGLSCGLDILQSNMLSSIRNDLHKVWFDHFDMYIDSSLKNAGFAKVTSGAAAYFLTIALSLECVLFFSTVKVHFDSQAVIDACLLELAFAAPDFYNQYWIERHHIFNLIRDKDLTVNWIKVKKHSEISGNKKTDFAAGVAVQSLFLLQNAEVCSEILAEASMHWTALANTHNLSVSAVL
ncbi:hypothetical protein G9A89_018499 [Geosiphon pyriformis]|nr:hypothetical protein G9A89_018499 [Geosiphon pyriformis]